MVSTRRFWLAALLGQLTVARNHLLVQREEYGASSGLCSPCVQLGEQGLNALLNYILQVGVVKGCSDLCSHVPQKAEQTACNLVCDIVGIKEFVKAIEAADLDPIYMCEELKACPMGKDDADVQLKAVSTKPLQVAKGDSIELDLDVQVVKESGVGEIEVEVTGPVTQSVQQGFLIPQGFLSGFPQFAVSLTIQDDESGDFPVVWSPGSYQVTFRACQGSCGSKHPHSKIFGEMSANFTLTDSRLTTNPTHYGDPATGCESDELAVRVQGLSGDFCSPKCDGSGDCPSDVPQGDTATPACALRTTTGDKYCALECQADSDCGTGACQKIAGIGICTYAAQSKLLSTMVTEVVNANPTHYGDPATGCESDELAVRVQGLSGDFCSPKCDGSGNCPTDVPQGDTATPACALRTTTGDKYCALECQADSDCGTGACQKIAGIGICTYAAPSKLLSTMVTEVVSANPTHYGDPATGCESDELAVRVQGLSGDFCSPKCDGSGNCPTDVPQGDSATPACALRTTTGDKYCALECQADSDCGTGACQKIAGIGICTYAAPSKLLSTMVTEVVNANPTHYGDPATGCESDELAVRVQGLSGDFCSPKCDGSGNCPTDVPQGDSATPACALRTTTGDKYCALECQADSDCGTGACQKIAGIGICTYAAPSKLLSTMVTEVVNANPTHYGDPATGCESDELAVRVQGLSGDFCSPKCDGSGNCPTDVPQSDSATPACALRTTTGDKYCALECQADSDCGTGACQKIAGIGICTYAAPSKLLSTVVAEVVKNDKIVVV